MKLVNEPLGAIGFFGAEFNSELQRRQQREAGESAPLDEPFLEPRDTKKLEKK